jgi:hypothetical protein
MLETRFVPSNAPSLSLISPVGRSTTSVGAEGDEAEVNAYREADACTLISRKGRTIAMTTLNPGETKRAVCRSN